jgi:hypothetical protein
MNIVVEKQPKCIATLNVEVPAADVAAKREKIASTYASQAKIAGFRPGKAPKAVIQKRFGKQISEELTEALFGEACDQALEKENLKVLDFGFPDNLNERPDGSIPDNHAFFDHNPDQYLYMHRQMIPALKAMGTTDAQIRTLFVDNPRRAVDASRLVKLQRCGDVGLFKGAAQHRAVLDRHDRPLCHVGQGGVGSVAQKRDAARAPIGQAGTVVQGPAIAGLAVGSIDHSLHIWVPTGVIVL